MLNSLAKTISTFDDIFGKNGGKGFTIWAVMNIDLYLWQDYDKAQIYSSRVAISIFGAEDDIPHI